MTSYTVGLDLGTANDYSALVVVERVFKLPPYISLSQWHRQPGTYQEHLVLEQRVRHIQRWELGSTYPSIVADVAELMRTRPMRDGLLFIDRSGVGQAVYHLFHDAHREQALGAYAPIGITATGGNEANGWNVPKRDLFAAVQAALQMGTLKIADQLPLGEALETELSNFRLKISANGRDTYEFQRTTGSGHGDIVSALSMALYQDNTLRRPDVVEDPSTLISGGMK